MTALLVVQTSTGIVGVGVGVGVAATVTENAIEDEPEYPEYPPSCK